MKENERRKKADYMRAWTAKNRGRINAERRARAAANPERNKRRCLQYYYANRERILKKLKAKQAEFTDRHRRWIAAHPERAIFLAKRARSKIEGIEFSLVFEDIVWPTQCPVLGIPLNYTRNRGCCTDDSPSFDRLDPSKGYVPGNTIVISHKANTIKSNASVADLEKVLAFYKARGI